MAGFLVLPDADITYTRMKAVAWVANRSLYPTTLQDSGDELLASLLEEADPCKPFVVNCQGMTGIDEHCLAQVGRAQASTSAGLVFTNANALADSIEHNLGPCRVAHSTQNGERVLVYAQQSMDERKITEIIQRQEHVEQAHIRQRVTDCFARFEHGKRQRLSSTPLLASGVFNARALISDPMSFVWVCLLLADKVDKLIADDRLRDPRLMAVSLRGSPLAAAVHLLARNEVLLEIVDHMGPKHKVLEEYSLKGVEPGRSYILISDFIVGGTELKTAQAYAHWNGCRVTHAVTIGCALQPSEYSQQDPPEVSVLPLLDLRQLECRMELAFYDSETA
jgi:hypothetical protein